MRGRLIAVSVNLCLFVFFSVTSATLKLLRCVRVPGVSVDSTRLFIAGDTACAYSGWQLPLVVVSVVLFAAPVLVVPWLAHGAHRHRHGAWTWAAVYRVLCGCYSPQLYWWECVLMAHRLVVAALFTFVVDQPVLRTLFTGVVTAVVLVCTVLLRPFRATVSHAVQCVLLVCLVVLSAAMLPPSYRDLLAIPGSTDGASATVQSSDHAVDVVVLTSAYVVPIVTVVIALSRKHLVRLSRRLYQ